jgi:hypothetical protein
VDINATFLCILQCLGGVAYQVVQDLSHSTDIRLHHWHGGVRR